MIFLNKTLLGYIRETKGGKSLDSQIEQLKEAGLTDFSETGPVFIDKIKYKTRSPTPDQLKYRKDLLLSLRQNNVVVVADYSILGLSAEDWLKTVSEIANKEAGLFICDKEEFFEWPDNTSKIAAKLAEGAAEAQAALVNNKTAKARKALADSNIKAGRKRDPETESKLKAAKSDWFDPSGPSSEEIAKKYGLSSRNTLIRAFGAITKCRKSNSK